MNGLPPARIDRDGAGTANAFRLAMRRLAATVTVVATGMKGSRCGITATAVTSLSMGPPSLIVCVNRQGALRDRLAHGSVFCVNVLSADHAEISRAFSGGMLQEDRFAFGEWGEEGGAPSLRDAQCSMVCEAAELVDWATHTIVIGTVRHVRLGEDRPPLVYCDGGFRSALPAA